MPSKACAQRKLCAGFFHGNGLGALLGESRHAADDFVVSRNARAAIAVVVRLLRDAAPLVLSLSTDWWPVACSTFQSAADSVWSRAKASGKACSSSAGLDSLLAFAGEYLEGLVWAPAGLHHSARRFSDELCRADDSCSYSVVYESKPTIQSSPSHHGIAKARIPPAIKAHCDNGMQIGAGCSVDIVYPSLG